MLCRHSFFFYAAVSFPASSTHAAHFSSLIGQRGVFLSSTWILVCSRAVYPFSISFHRDLPRLKYYMWGITNAETFLVFTEMSACTCVCASEYSVCLSPVNSDQIIKLVKALHWLWLADELALSFYLWLFDKSSWLQASVSDTRLIWIITAVYVRAEMFNALLPPKYQGHIRFRCKITFMGCALQSLTRVIK